MKIFIMTDMEGVCGVLDHDNWVTPNGMYYREGKDLLTREINAAVEGFYAAGATEILVADAHGFGGINQSLLDSRTQYIRLFPEHWPFMLDETFDALAFVGQHAKAGSEYAHIAHTEWFNVFDYTVNGISVGEFGLLVMCAASLGVRCIFGSGDMAFTKEAKQLVNGIRTVSVKRGLKSGAGDEYDCDGYRNRNLAAIHMHPEKARELIRSEAEGALKAFAANREAFQLLDMKPPFNCEVSFRPDNSSPAHIVRKEHPDNLIKMLNIPQP